MPDVLFICTANQSRSPIAAELLRRRLAERGVDGVRVASAGLLQGGAPASAAARAALDGLDGHVSRRITPTLVGGADLVVGLCREHVREVAVLAPGTLRRAFTLKELVRRAEVVGPRAPGEPLGSWLDRVGAGRRATDLIDADELDDVADPTGGPPEGWARTIEELDGLTGRLAELAWPATGAVAGSEG
jgi:protein-tyrosine phosphatase